MKASSKIIAGLVAILLLCSAVTPIVLAAESTDEAVLTGDHRHAATNAK